MNLLFYPDTHLLLDGIMWVGRFLGQQSSMQDLACVQSFFCKIERR